VSLLWEPQGKKLSERKRGHYFSAANGKKNGVVQEGRRGVVAVLLGKGLRESKPVSGQGWGKLPGKTEGH